MASGSHEEHAFHPKDAIAYTMKATFQVGGAGALVAAIQNTLTRQNVGAMGFLTRFGGTTATFGALDMGGGAIDRVDTNVLRSGHGSFLRFCLDCQRKSPTEE